MADRVVSQELTEKIVQFQEVTGTEDMEAAWRQLERHGWDLVAAVQDHLTVNDSTTFKAAAAKKGSSSMEGDSGGGATPPMAAPEGVPGPSSPSGSPPSPPPPGGSTERQATPGVHQATTTASHAGIVRRGVRSLLPPLSGWGLLGWGYYLMTLPLRLTLTSLSSILLFLYRIVYPYPRRLSPHHIPTVTDPLEDVLRFIREYEAEYGTHHPAFFQGSYSQALSHAKTELKFLLVYLHCADHQDTPFFCRTMLSDATLIEYINTMVFWGCSVTSSEGYRVSQAMRENSYPFLAVVVLRTAA
ncbi:FAS-associated factor 2 [Chionoecetes opilio]|uniref:FAS-associated factor 2 n=1 Tax=Chionoecetes opilio TaxID=41210 RepID=A0A8J4YBG8_CHIOP|nr:FAS-associated factor 2 [Chionoecetes opilio]